MAVNNFLGKSKRAVQPVQNEPILQAITRPNYSPLANNSEVIFDALVVDVLALFNVGHCDFGVTNARSSGSQAGSEGTPHDARSVGRSLREVQHPARGKADLGDTEENEEEVGKKR